MIFQIRTREDISEYLRVVVRIYLTYKFIIIVRTHGTRNTMEDNSAMKCCCPCYAVHVRNQYMSILSTHLIERAAGQRSGL